MIALRSDADCQYCPFSLICLGDAWDPIIARGASLRICTSCHAIFFTVGHNTYICNMLYWKRQRLLGRYATLATTQNCGGRRGDGTAYASNCFELYQRHLEPPQS